MSAFVKLCFTCETRRIPTLEYAIKRVSEKQAIGVFFQSAYCESFERAYDYSMCVSISDSCEYDNCENLMKPWWYINTNMENYTKNMGKIQRIIEEALTMINSVHVWIGTSGDSINDFDEEKIVVSDFFHCIMNKYNEYSKLPPPPSVHLIVTQ